ncbi:MAG: hypothetical protein COV66_01785 [Nitrospinae bacterium CG11_big_fil_rev_8_21_14_0_20_45_15]|nr:MAG: hypothetical protein COV66_01785 [Nitrospinae bacterium CG11_big_fil_rev_8_21_14_0_20_45_15]
MIFKKMITGPSIPSLITEGYLVPVEYYVPSKPDLDGLRIRRGDYEERGLSEKMDQPKLIGDIVENWLRICPDRQTVIFATGVRHSIHIRDRFAETGISAEHIDGGTITTERDAILSAFGAGEIQVISNCMVLTEGWDCPGASALILARPTKSLGLYLQMAGRVLRPNDGKVNSIVIDHSGAYFEHGPVDQDFQWSLEPGSRVQGATSTKSKDKAKPITCRECTRVYEGRPDCPACGHREVKKGKYLNVVDGTLERVDENGNLRTTIVTEQERNIFYRQLDFIRKKRGYKPGWSGRKFEERFGEWPNSRDKCGLPLEAEAEVLSFIRKGALRYANQQRHSKTG